MKDWSVRTAALLGMALVALIVGYLVPDRPLVAITIAGGVLVMGLSALNRALTPLLVIPLLFVVARVGAGGVDVSVSDVALATATVPAVMLTRPLSAPMRNLLWFIALYLFATLFTVMANPYPANAVEWVHAAVLLGGALFVGWSIGREGFGSTALTLMLITASVLSLLVVISGVTGLLNGSFEAVSLSWPFEMHKNFIGVTLGITAVIAYVRPAWMGWSRALGLTVFSWLALGIAFSQSRQAIVALGVVLVILVLRTRTERRRSKAVVFAVIPALLYVLSIVSEQASSDNKFNSYFQRITWFSESIEVWQTSPIVGVGLRWWYTDTFDYRFQPPNAELEVLTSAGVVGLAAFVILMIACVVILWRLPTEYGMLAVLAVLSRLVQSQFDLFWTAVHVSLPFVIAGICLGELARAQKEPEQTKEFDVRTEPAATNAPAVVPR